MVIASQVFIVFSKFFLSSLWIGLTICLSLLPGQDLLGTPLQEKETKISLSSEDFLLKNYENVAIATDLEPDDVFALAILFKEANRIYSTSSQSKYPIDLIVVGEGNTTIKRLRMEMLLQKYFDLPPGVSVRVVEGRATTDNIFTYDGEELFEKETLKNIPFPLMEQERHATEVLQTWAEHAENPFIIQLKPASELLALPPDVTRKITLLFYGSFNIRKMIDTKASSLSMQLELLMSHFSQNFSKVAILESFGTLGNQPCVSSEFGWTHKIAQIVAHSDDAFIRMFYTLTNHWNAYSLDKILQEGEQITQQLAQETNTKELSELHTAIVQLQKKWSSERFEQIFNKISSAEVSNGNLAWKTLIRKFELAKKIKSGVQFTFADILVAMAATNTTHLFHATPIHPVYDDNGFLIPIPDPNSNIVYYDAVDREKFAQSIEQFLEQPRSQ